MIELLITLIPSIIWLVYRCIQVLRAPADDIIHDLNIDIPYIPNICIDAVSCSSITIHWDINTVGDEQLNYIVMVNHQEAATLSSTNCQFNDLTPDTIYQIQIVAVNLLNNFKSQSNPIFVETTSDVENEGFFKKINNNDAIIKKLNDFHHQDFSSLKDQILIDDITGETNQGLLSQYLKFNQYKLLQILNEFSQQQSNIDQEIFKITESSKSLHENLKQSNQVLHASSANFKEKQKRKEEVMLMKNKIVDNLIDIKKTYEQKLKKIDNLNDELTKLTNQKDKIELKKFNEKDEINDNINHIKIKISNLKQKINEQDVMLKNSKNNKRQINNYWEFLKKLVEPWQKEKVFNDDNSINNRGLDILNNIMSNTTWSSEIQSDLNELNRLDNAWRNNFKLEIKNYVSNARDLENLKLSKDANYIPKFIDEFEASIEFGGEANKIFKKRRNRNRSKSQTLSSSSSSSPGPNQTMNNIHDFYGDIYADDIALNQPQPLISVQLGHSLSSPAPSINQIHPSHPSHASSQSPSQVVPQLHTQIVPPLQSSVSPQIQVQSLQNLQSQLPTSSLPASQLSSNYPQPQPDQIAPHTPGGSSQSNLPNIYNNQDLDALYWNNSNINLDRSFLNVYNHNPGSPTLQNNLTTTSSINSNIWDANFHGQSWNYNNPGNLKLNNHLNNNNLNHLNGVNAPMDNGGVNLDYPSKVFDYLYKEEEKS